MEVIYTKPESFVVQTISIPNVMMIDHCVWTSRLSGKIKGERDKKRTRFTVGNRFNRTVILFPRNILSHQFETRLHVICIFHENLNDISSCAIGSTTV